MIDARFDAFGRRRLTAVAANLGLTRDTRLHLMPVGIRFQHLAELLVVHHRVRTRSNQRHISVKHIPELRQLIQARAAQKTANLCNAGIVFRSLAHIGTIFHHRHRAELEHFKHALIAAPAALAEQNRPRTIELDRQRDQRHERRDHQRDNAADRQIFEPLDDGSPTSVTLGFDIEQSDRAQLRNPVRTRSVEEIGSQVRDDVQIDRQILELAGNVVHPAFGNLRQGNDDPVDAAFLAGLDKVVETTRNRQTFSIDPARIFARIVDADEMQPERRIGQVIMNPPCDMPCTVNGDPLIKPAFGGFCQHDVAGNRAHQNSAGKARCNPKDEPDQDIGKTDFLGRSEADCDQYRKYDRPSHVGGTHCKIMRAARIVHASGGERHPVDQCGNQRRLHHDWPVRRDGTGSRVQRRWDQPAGNHRERFTKADEIGSNPARPNPLGLASHSPGQTGDRR